MTSWEQNWEQNWEKACRNLASRDTILSDSIIRYDGEKLRPSGDAFSTLANAVIGQQISVRAADAIWKRLSVKFSADGGFLDLNSVENASESELRACGLSLRKAEYLKGLCHAFTHGHFSDSAWRGWDDTPLTQTLTALRGIGPWTAHMFLIFHLGRLNILPSADLGLLKAFRAKYTDGTPQGTVLKKLLEEHAAAHWTPYRTVATWYLWRGLDPEPVAY